MWGSGLSVSRPIIRAVSSPRSQATQPWATSWITIDQTTIAMTPMTMNGSMNWRGREPKRAAYNSSFDAAFQRHAAPMAFDGKRALARGKQVLELEAEAVRLLADALDGPAFLRACELLLACTGRVVVTGMGKAGLVGQKISATLASTGTPSLFLHPGEALHGDLGRVRPEDVVLALSKSGGTREVVQLLGPVRAIGAPIIALCESADSPLGGGADLVLSLGQAPEACPLGLAPTVSTTVMLALGDALAMAVLEGRDFTREEFARFHPAGSLGKQLMQVGEIMRDGAELPLVTIGSTVADVLAVMSQTPGRPGAALVVDQDQKLRGIFTDATT